MRIIKLILAISFILPQILFADYYKRFEIGSKNAPIIMYEFMSLKCPHCAKFHTEVYPDFKKNYVDTGKVRVVFMDAPFGGSENILAHKILYASANEAEFLSLSTGLYSIQKQWANKPNAEKILINYAKMNGISESKLNKVINDKQLESWLMSELQQNFKLLNIQGTPTFVFVKNGDKIENFKLKLVGAQSYKDISKAVDNLLK